MFVNYLFLVLSCKNYREESYKVLFYLIPPDFVSTLIGPAGVHNIKMLFRQREIIMYRRSWTFRHSTCVQHALSYVINSHL